MKLRDLPAACQSVHRQLQELEYRSHTSTSIKHFTTECRLEACWDLCAVEHNKAQAKRAARAESA